LDIGFASIFLQALPVFFAESVFSAVRKIRDRGNYDQLNFLLSDKKKPPRRCAGVMLIQ